MSQNRKNGDSRVDNSDQTPAEPKTSKDMVEGVKEVLSGEGERISERAPAVPFAVVFMSYFIVLIAVGVIIAVLVEFFGWRG